MQYRTELKFICDPVKMLRIEDAVRCICMADPYAGADGSYLIRSLYFDSPEMMYYLQTKNGLDHRHKYRIRIYNRSDDRITLEKKESLHGKKHKDIAPLTADELSEIILGTDIPFVQDDNETKKSFLSDVQCYSLKPVTIIEYLRAPYVYPVGNVRITFDRNILASDSTDLFADNLTGSEVLFDGSGILEVKYDDVLPRAISRIFSAYDLQAGSFSKYVRAMDALNGIYGG